MEIIAIDDEPLLLRAAERAIREAVPDAEIVTFQRASEALREIEDKGIRPDAVFTDIEMPGMNGLEFAVKLKDISRKTRIIFTTGYTEYAVEAFKVHAHGYVMKPLTAERVREELEQDAEPHAAEKDKIEVRCFGYFEVFWKGEPLKFARSKTKELLAFLIDREGAMCTSEEIAASLWEDESDIKKSKDRIRHLVQDLNRTLRGIGMENAVIRRSGLLGIRRELLDCDYYRMLNGDVDALNSYYGDYMNQYSWAEITHGRLELR